MSNTQLNSLVLGRAAGRSFGVPEGDLGRLSLIAYTMGNPLLAIAAARSMARNDGQPPDDCDDKDGLVAEITDDPKAATDAAVKAEKAAEGARPHADAAPQNAMVAAAAAATGAAAAQLAAADAQKAAADAQAAAKTGDAAKASMSVLTATKK
jgi:hypothetical protein